MSQSDQKRHFDIIVNIPLEEELNAFLNVFNHKNDLSNDTQFRCEVNTDSDLTMLVLLQDQMGKSSATNSITEAIDEFTTNLIVCLGIAGGLSKDLKLGDVCYSGTVLDVSDNSKTMDGENGDIKLELSPFAYHTEKAISLSLDFIRRDPAFREQYIDWQQSRFLRATGLNLPEISNSKGENPKKSEPHSMSGVIACGAVSAGKNYNEKLKQIDRKVLAIETESGGVFNIAKRNDLHALTIRGISDYADPDKEKLEAETSDSVRLLAAENAASFLKLQLGNSRFVEKIKEDLNALQKEQASTDKLPAAKNLQELVLGGQAYIDRKLRDLSPEFRLHDKGYQMPMPSLIPEREEDRQARKDAPVHDILDCITLDQHVYVSLDKSYPDKSIAWIIADHLIRSEIDGKQILPVVIEGESIRPPRYTMELAAPKIFEHSRESDEHQVVVVIDGLPISSKTRINYILKQIENHEDAKFIYVDRTEANSFLQSEFATAVNAKAYQISDISFAQIAYFIQRNFDLEGSESEAIAFRLRDTFQKFELKAHPSYFAGIPKETLAALAQANKRTELMQLGVDGFLTFLVAGDQSEINLSRTTRGKFLRDLIYRMRVEKTEFSEDALILYTNEFAKKYDFNIKAMDFIGEFVKRGILYFDHEKVRVAVPFIENYLLAQELAIRPNQAKRYFDLGNYDFDMATFDLYCEIQPSREIVENVTKMLTDAISNLDDSSHILLGDEIDPASIISMSKLKNLENKIGQAAKDISDEKNTTAEKQQLIDITEHVAKKSSEKSQAIFKLKDETGKEKVEEEDKKLEEMLEVISKLSFSSNVGSLLLGYGAEHLDATDKRKLSKLIAEAVSLLIDRWTRFHEMIDFEEMRSEMTSDEFIDTLDKKYSDSKMHSERKSKKELKSMISDYVDVVRFVFLSNPFREAMGMLVENARNPILERSISAVKMDQPFSELVRSIWISDLELKDGERPLNEATKKLPKTSLLRVCIAEHLLKRVYWSHAKKTHRLKLLETAEVVLKAINLSVNSREYKKLINDEAKPIDKL